MGFAAARVGAGSSIVPQGYHMPCRLLKQHLVQEWGPLA